MFVVILHQYPFTVDKRPEFIDARPFIRNAGGNTVGRGADNTDGRGRHVGEQAEFTQYPRPEFNAVFGPVAA